MLKKLGMFFTLAFIVTLGFVFNGGQASAATPQPITANLYVKSTDNLVLPVNAYLTNSFVMPTSAVSNNATILDNNDGTYTLSVPVVNNTFALISIDAPNGGVSNIVETRNTGTYGSNTNGRITNLTMTIEQGTTSVYFTNCHEYSSYFVSKGDKNFNLTLDVDWSNVK